MKHYEIYDTELEKSLGTLLYFEKEKTFLIELDHTLDEWTAPLLLTSFVKKKVFTIPRDISLLWVRERIIPADRQNIQSILHHSRLTEYDEMKLLLLSSGVCSMDSIMIRKQDSLPEYVVKGWSRHLIDVVACEENQLLLFFQDDTVRKIDLTAFMEQTQDEHRRSDLEKVLTFPELYESCRVGAGGYYITFNDTFDIPAEELYRAGLKLPIRLQDFYSFAKNNLLDTTESCALLECSRQNLFYMVQKEQLSPIKEEVKGNLYLKGHVIRNTW